jgi:prefoldin subunit 5
MQLSFILAGCLAAALATESEVTPVQKVVVLLQEMLAKGKTEKHDEQVQFAAYKQFCDDTSMEKKRAIKEGEESMEMLKADIQKHGADATQLAKEIAEHEADISTWNGDSKASSNVRTIEKADYDATHKDYSESVDALQRAVQILKKQAYDRKQKSSLVEVSSLNQLPLIPNDAKKAIDAFLQQEPASGLDVAAPDAAGYEFQSHGVIEMLEKLHDKFIDERTNLEKQETNAKHAHDMLQQDLKAQIDQATTDHGDKSVNKAKSLQSKADATGDLTDTTATRDQDKKYLTELTATCEMKASDFESRQQLRAEEIEAIEKAIEILSGDAVAGAAEKHLPQLLQAPRASSVALAQLRAGKPPSSQERAVQYLRDQAGRLNSHVLSALAVRAAEDPFAKVKKMLKDLIVRLMEEANEEAEHKGWCDTELSTNEQTRKEKTAAVETLHAEIDELEASIAKLTEDLATLSKAIADLDAAMAEATTLRQEEKATNTATVKDAQEAQTAVAQALVVLKEFYAKAAEATALVQQRSHQNQPAIFDSPYTGMSAESGGVVGMLEVVQSDFARLETETAAAEETAQKEYDSFMTESKVDKAQKTTDTEHKTAKKQDQEQALTTKQSDLEGTQKELDAALAYYDKLKPSCVDAGTTYEDRVGRRKEEIESLQEALRILNGEDIA